MTTPKRETAVEAAYGICNLIIHNWKPEGDDLRIAQIAAALEKFAEDAHAGGKAFGYQLAEAELLLEAEKKVKQARAETWEEAIAHFANLSPKQISVDMVIAKLGALSRRARSEGGKA